MLSILYKIFDDRLSRELWELARLLKYLSPGFVPKYGANAPNKDARDNTGSGNDRGLLCTGAFACSPQWRRRSVQRGACRHCLICIPVIAYGHLRYGRGVWSDDNRETINRCGRSPRTQIFEHEVSVLLPPVGCRRWHDLSGTCHRGYAIGRHNCKNVCL